MKIGAGGPLIQTAEEFQLNPSNKKLSDVREISEHPERVEAQGEEGKHVTASYNQVVQTVQDLNKFSTLSDTHLQFQIHDKTKRLMVKVLDEEGEVIREIPPEEALEMLAKLQEMSGAILDRYI